MVGSSSIAALIVVLMMRGMGLCEDAGTGQSALSCRMELTSLLPCTTFVQGTTPEPTESCCDNLGDIYRQQPQCLCSFLNTSSSTFNSFLPINRTLMLKLPAVCNLITDDDTSACKMVSFREAKNKTSTTRGGGDEGKNNNQSVAASPMIQVTPRPTPTAFMHSHSPKLLLLVTTNFLLSPLILLYCFQL